MGECEPHGERAHRGYIAFRNAVDAFAGLGKPLNAGDEAIHGLRNHPVLVAQA
jgi:hypothetical protein